MRNLFHITCFGRWGCHTHTHTHIYTRLGGSITQGRRAGSPRNLPMTHFSLAQKYCNYGKWKLSVSVSFLQSVQCEAEVVFTSCASLRPRQSTAKQTKQGRKERQFQSPFVIACPFVRSSITSLTVDRQTQLRERGELLRTVRVH